MSMLQHALRRRSLSLYLQRTSPCCFQANNAFSSQSDGGKGNPQNRVPKTLYRQLLVWCRRYDDVPFTPLPPVTLSPPQVNPLALKRLKDMRSFLSVNDIKDSIYNVGLGDDITIFGHRYHPAHYAMYKEGVFVKKDMITFPEITDANQLRAIIRSIYWLNNQHTLENIEGVDNTEDQGDGTKEQITLAFEAIKSCNQLASGELDSRRRKREFSIQVREGTIGGSEDEELPSVEYHVGQVIKHREKWRGVVVGWVIEKDKIDGRLSSLTTKQYALNEDKASDDSNVSTKKSKVQYTVLVDFNDANLLQISKTVSLESQEDLSPVDDPCLQRIYNNLIKQYFTKFDTSGHFVPNNILAYVYPLDRFSDCKFGDGDDAEVSFAEPKTSPELMQSSLAITEGVQEISRRLMVPFSESGQQDKTDDDALSMISTFSSNVQSMSMEHTPSQTSDSAISSLLKLYHLHVKTNAILWTRNVNQQHKHDVNFSIGQIVKHKIYGFRGIVGAWDAKPRMDVSNWDGLTGIENPQEKPFYHVYPDVNDCIQAFGGARNFRYVCQDNLELSPLSDKPLELETELDPAEWKWDGDSGRYIPSAEMKFMYAEDLGEHEETLVSTIHNLRSTLTDCFLEIRDGESNDLFSMDNLFYQLQVGVQNMDDATTVQDLIREIWKESSNCDLRNQLDTGIADLVEGRNENALDAFSSIVAYDPLYGEAWNKKATVHYMMGQIDKSVQSAEEALKIDNRNFQALAGLGLIEMDSLHYDKAIESFRKCLAINPWLATVSSRLSVCMSKNDNGSKFP